MAAMPCVITADVTVFLGTLVRSGTGANPNFRFFDVGSGGALSLANVTLQNGLNNTTIGGGAVYVEGNASLSTFETVFTDNQATSSGGDGGAVICALTATNSMNFENSTFTDNSSQQNAGAIAFYCNGNILQSTFTGNSSVVDGGAVLVFNNTTIENSTFCNNFLRLAMVGPSLVVAPFRAFILPPLPPILL